MVTFVRACTDNFQILLAPAPAPGPVWPYRHRHRGKSQHRDIPNIYIYIYIYIYKCIQEKNASQIAIKTGTPRGVVFLRVPLITLKIENELELLNYLHIFEMYGDIE
jgi:hypothetical protein